MRFRWILLLLAVPLAAQEEDETAFVVAGTVQRANGKPAEAAVFVWDALAADRPLAQGRTGTDGAFRLAVTRSAAARRDHPFGPVRVVVHEAGWARAERVAAPGAADLPFRLVRPAKWEGTVRNREGEPLPGAPIVARQGSIRLATTTDEQGHFAFEDLGPGATAVTADATGYAARTIEEGALDFVLDSRPVVKGQIVHGETLRPLAGAFVVALDGDVAAESDADGRFSMELKGGKGRIGIVLPGYAMKRVEFAGGAVGLEEAEDVRGVVVDEEGEPVPFAQVRLDPGFDLPRHARADAAGRFEFPVGVSGFAFVEARARGFLPGRGTVDPGWRADRVRVALRRGRAVEGEVSLDGEPVLGAEVVFYRVVPPHGRAEVARAYANAEGKVRLDALPPGAAIASASGAGARSVDVPVEKKMWFRLEERPPLLGVVRDDAGKPVPGVAVARTPAGEGSVLTGDDGAFEFPHLDDGRYEIAVEGGETWRGARREARPGQRVDLILERKRGPHRLVARVRGARAHAARVLLRGDGWRQERWLAPGDDEARFDDLSNGAVRLRVDAPGFQDAERELVVADDREETRVDVALPRAGTLRVKATAGASVVIVTLEGEPAPVQTLKLARGVDVVAGFGPGRYRFLARAPGEAIVVREIAVGEKDPPRDLDLTGGPASTLRVVVTDGGGKPVRGVSIDLVTEGGFPYRTGVKTDENGVAELSRLILGRVSIVAHKAERRAQQILEVEPDRRYEAEMTLP